VVTNEGEGIAFARPGSWSFFSLQSIALAEEEIVTNWVEADFWLFFWLWSVRERIFVLSLASCEEEASLRRKIIR
jgi:hypothetical protein